MQLTSRIHEAADLEAAVEYCYQQNWTDGLPVIPPTEGAVERIINYLQRGAEEVVGIIPPRNGIATIEKIAINCVMAGCKPEYAPIVIAALEAMLEERFNLNGVQATTSCCAPLTMVSGPAVKTLGFNTRENAFGHGSRANAAIGRAVRLILWNIGGGYPGDPCKTTLGQPGYYSFCLAEDADSNPWTPLHTDGGFARDDTVATVTAVGAPNLISTGAGTRPAADVLYVLARSIAVVGSPNINGGSMVLVLGPMTARNLADAGYSKADVVRELMRQATISVRSAKRRHVIPESHPLHWSKFADPNDDDARVPFIRRAEDIVILVTGAWGSAGAQCALCTGWGAGGGNTVRRKVRFPGG